MLHLKPLLLLLFLWWSDTLLWWTCFQYVDVSLFLWCGDDEWWRWMVDGQWWIVKVPVVKLLVVIVMK